MSTAEPLEDKHILRLGVFLIAISLIGFAIILIFEFTSREDVYDPIVGNSDHVLGITKTDDKQY
jgi:hypothetical protein